MYEFWLVHVTHDSETATETETETVHLALHFIQKLEELQMTLQMYAFKLNCIKIKTTEKYFVNFSNQGETITFFDENVQRENMLLCCMSMLQG